MSLNQGQNISGQLFELVPSFFGEPGAETALLFVAVAIVVWLLLLAIVIRLRGLPPTMILRCAAQSVLAFAMIVGFFTAPLGIYLLYRCLRDVAEGSEDESSQT